MKLLAEVVTSHTAMMALSRRILCLVRSDDDLDYPLAVFSDVVQRVGGGKMFWKRERRAKLGFFSSFEVIMLSKRACRTKTKGAGRTTGLLLKQALRSKPGNNSRLALHVANAMLLERKACQLR